MKNFKELLDNLKEKRRAFDEAELELKLCLAINCLINDEVKQ